MSDLDLPGPEGEQNHAAETEAFGLFPLRDLVGQIVEVTTVEEIDGIPIVYVAHEDGRDRGYLATGEWAAAGATNIQAYLKTRGGDQPVQVRVVDHPRSGVGFETV